MFPNGCSPQFPCPSNLIDQLNNVHCANLQLVQVNSNLQNKLVRSEVRDRAYQDYVTHADQCLYTFGPSGRPLMLLNCAIDGAVFVRPQLPFTCSPFYAVFLRDMDQPLWLKEQDYLRDQVLLNALQQLPGVNVQVQRSVRTTATLLRQAIGSCLTTLDLSFYAGWSSSQSGGVQFRLFPSGRPHLDIHAPSLEPAEPVSSSPSATAAAAARFWPVFSCLTDPTVRLTTWLWFHAAALSSLLDQVQHPLPLALAFFSSDQACCRFLDRLFRWYEDPAVSLDAAHREFNVGLLSHKDQPLLIRDGHLANSRRNTEALAEALVNRSIPFTVERTIVQLPLQALPTFITSRTSSLLCSPEAMVLEVSPDHFNRIACENLSARFNLLPDYLAAFTAYVGEHVDQLRSALRRAESDLSIEGCDDLPDPHFQALCTLSGLSHFLTEFAAACAPEHVPDLPDLHVQEEILLSLLAETAQKQECCSDLSTQFISVTRSLISQELLLLCPPHADTHQNSTTPAVFYTEDALSFTMPAFRLVCQRLFASLPEVTRALADAGLLLGKSINATTAQTRISIWLLSGIRQTVAVYQLPRSAFDQLGDPLMIPVREEEFH